MPKTSDVVIIGGGIIGLSTAFQIARRSSLRVTVLDKGAGPGEGSTGASSAVCRHRYTFDEMVYLARDGIRAYRHWSEFTGLNQPLAKFHNQGVLWMPGSDADWSGAEHRRMRDLGIRTEVLDDDDLAERFPALNPCTIVPDTVSATPHDCVGGGGHLLELDGGSVEPMDALQDLCTVCRGGNVELRFNAGVGELRVSGGRVAGVAMENGSQIDAAVVINAAGPWCNRFIDREAFTWPWKLVPTRIQMVQIELTDAIGGDLPVCGDFSAGIYFRTQNRAQQLVIGSIRPEDEQESVDDPDTYERLADDDFAASVLHAFQHRIPAFSYQGSIRGYSGLYKVNRDDVHPVVGETPIGGYYVANGFSSHGFKLAPAIGALLARQITGEPGAFDTGVSSEFLANGPIAVDARRKVGAGLSTTGKQTMTIAYLNGSYLPLDQARISPMDRGFLFGDGIYEVIPSYGGRLVGFGLHMARMRDSLSAIEIPLAWTDDDWRAICDELIRKNAAGNLGVYLHVSRGADRRRHHAYPEGLTPTVFGFAFDIQAPPPSDRHAVRPFKISSAEDKRWMRCDIKTTALLGNVMHFQQGKAAGNDETLLFNAAEEVTEGSTSSVFIVEDGAVATPPLDHQVLPGITRMMLLDILRKDGSIPIEERIITIQQARNADEIWLSSSTKEFMPVAELDGAPVGGGEAGPVWETAHCLYSAKKYDY